MCYDAVSATKTLIKYCQHRGEDPNYIAALECKLEELRKVLKPHYHTSGFAHPKLMVFTNEKPHEPQAYRWGLIPSWCKDEATAKSMATKTLNARSETIFELPSFRGPAKNKRCLIYLDAFYEHHHLAGKTFPFYISAKDDSPLAIGGIWDEWVNKATGEVVNTVSIVTTVGNETMARVHNNPRAEGPRMPVILDRNKQDQWLTEYTGDQTKEMLLKELAVPYPDDLLEVYPVKRLRGKEAIGNVPEAQHRFDYPELSSTLF